MTLIGYPPVFRESKAFVAGPPQDYPIVTGAVQEVHFKQGFRIEFIS